MEKENWLIVVDSNMEIRDIDLRSFKKSQISFGRDSSNNIVLKSNIVSREHGAFEFVNDEVYIYDKGSTNGLVINNKVYKINSRGESDARKLRNGDVIRIDDISENSDHKMGVMMLYLTHRTAGSWHGMNIVSNDRIVIGRHPQCAIHLESINVSHQHAAVYMRNGQCIIEDLHSTNGVFINGQRIIGCALLRDKDIIHIANSILFFANGIIVYKSSTDGTRVTMHNVSRTINIKGQKRYILRDVNLTVEPNEFIAIIGGSGAGKSTVMNAMSGFEQATSGNVYVNDIDLYKNYQTLKNIIGYVPQQDIIYDNITLIKMLEYSAKLRMPQDISTQERNKRIRDVLKMVELEEHKDKFIRSLSGGQKKRASIAVELLADPGLFFLDEPTSGLDPGTEESLMKTLNRLAKQKGKTIVMVTHTTQNLHLCDKILFMGKGGRVCFYGSPAECTTFFGVDNLTEIYNKALTDEEVMYWANKYCQEYRDDTQNEYHTGKGITQQKKTLFFKQFGILTARYITLIKNDTQRLLMIFAQPIIIAILIALVAAGDVFDIYNSTKSILFALSCAGIWVGLFNSIQEICKERSILKREYMANLNLGAYVLSKFAVQLLMSIIQAFVMMILFALFVGSPSDGVIGSSAFAEMFITLLLTIFSSSAIGLVVSSVSKNSDKAMTTAPFLLIIQLLFSGILFELEDMTEKISYITISRWSVSSFGTIANLNALEMSVAAIPHEAEDIYEYTVSNICQSWIILGGFIAICIVLCAILLRSVAKDSR